MSEDQSPEDAKPEPEVNESRPAIRPLTKQRSLTPEQRRFMGTSRIREEKPAEEKQPTTEAQAPEPPEPEALEDDQPVAESADREPRKRAEKAATKRRAPSLAAVEADRKASRAAEMQTPLLVVGAALVLFGAFFVGMKFNSLKSALFSGRTAQKEFDGFVDKFPGVSADELVVQALKSERRGDRQDAADRFVAAKHKNLSYRGILFHVGKLAYDAGDFDGADKLFERAIAFGEDPATANYFRGLIAVRHSDLAAAQRFFETAATDDPFTAQYHYYLAEALRIDHHPNESIPRYERSQLLAVNEQEAVVSQFKIRMARIEAGDAPKVAAEMAERKIAAEMPLDWLMTAAALNIIQGQVEDALPLIARARSAGQSGLFNSCVEDLFFVNAASKNPAIASALKAP